MPKRGRKPVLTPAIVARIQSRRRSGVSYEDLVREFGLSKGSICKALKMPAVSDEPAQRPPARKRASTVANDTDADAVVSGNGGGEDTVERVIDDVGVMIEQAKKAKDMSRLAQAMRMRLSALALREKLRPPPLEDKSDDPAYTTAASEAITRLERLLDREQKRRQTWPICDKCGQHVRPANDPDVDRSPAQRWAAALTEAMA